MPREGPRRARTAGPAAWVLLAGLALGPGCAPAASPLRLAPAAIETDHDRYVLRPGPVGEEATIVARFRAPADTTVYIVHCNGAIAWGLQRLEDGRWTDAWAATTNGCLSPPFVVAGGQALADTLTVVSRDDVPATGPVRHVVPPGTYRMVWYGVLTAFDARAQGLGPELSLERRVSAAFTLERAAPDAPD
jgi:hypothetical protein